MRPTAQSTVAIDQHAITRRDWLVVATGLIALAALYALSDRIFDAACDLAFVIGAVTMLEMARNLRFFARDDYPLFLAVGVGFVALIQLLNAAVQPYIHLFASATANLAAQLQLASGLLLAAAMLIAPFVIGRRVALVPLLLGYAVSTGLLAALAFGGLLPRALSAAGNATGFAVTSDLTVAVALLGAAGLTHRRRPQLEPRLAAAVEVALCVAALGWLVRIVLPSDDVSRMMAVLFVGLLYVAVTENGLARPTYFFIAELRGQSEHEVRERARAQAQLRDSEERYRTVFEQSPAGILLFDHQLIVTRCNARLCELLQTPRAIIVGSDLHEMPDAQLVAQLGASLAGRLGTFEGRLPNPFSVSDEQERIISARIAPLAGSAEQASGGVAIIVDLTESKRAEDLIEQLAFHDSLTGLANRSLLRDRLRHALLAAERAADPLAVLCLDVDHFASLNHLIGHASADRVLQEVAKRLESAVRASDTVARWGADEFIILLPDVSDPAGATHVTEQLVQALAVPLQIDGRAIALTASIGIALFPQDGIDAETLLKHVVMAKDRAKVADDASVRFYDAATGHDVMEHVALADDLRRALREGELVLYYQPQIELESDHIVAVEALVRWQHPQRGFLPPDVFVPIAESVGLIEELTTWVVNEACRQTAVWQEQGYCLRTAVNVSARDFRSGHVCAVVDAALADSGLAPQWLEVELTETAIVEDSEATAEQLTALRERGVTVALDDFGTGYSSLSHLSTLPISRVKIDRAFVSRAAVEEREATIVGAMIGLIHSLGLEAIAEGIETEADLAFLRGQACDLGQGYFFARPLPADECSELLSRRAPANVL